MQVFCCGQCLRAESRGSPGVCLGKQERDGGHSIVPVPSSPLSSAPVEGDFYFYCFYCLKRAQLGLSTIRLFLGSSGSPAGCSLGWGWGLILFKSTFLQNLGQAQPRGGPRKGGMLPAPGKRNLSSRPSPLPSHSTTGPHSRLASQVRTPALLQADSWCSS